MGVAWLVFKGFPFGAAACLQLRPGAQTLGNELDRQRTGVGNHRKPDSICMAILWGDPGGLHSDEHGNREV